MHVHSGMYVHGMLLYYYIIMLVHVHVCAVSTSSDEHNKYIYI